MERVASTADKLIFLLEDPGVTDSNGRLISNLLLKEVDAQLEAVETLPEDIAQSYPQAPQPVAAASSGYI